MKRFFTDLEQLNKFTSQIKINEKCSHCSRGGYLISHGFIYKKTIDGSKQIIGKRIYCSNRYNKNGCGQTIQLYISFFIPRIQYSTTQLEIFILSLINAEAIDLSYFKATKSKEPRNAYRWIKKLHERIDIFRYQISLGVNKFITWFDRKIKSSNINVLISTLSQLKELFGETFSKSFQELSGLKFI